MKKTLLAATLLLLTACSPSSQFVQGEVVSCKSISQDLNFTAESQWIALMGQKVPN
jgi:hypothetical protein